MKKFVLSIFVVACFINSYTSTAQSWEQTKGPGGGSVVDFIEKNGTILAATLGGIFRSTDNGNTWVRSMNGIADEVFVSTFASTGNYIYGGSRSYGLYRSSNNGITWQPVNVQVANLFISKIFASHDTLYIGCDGCGVYRSVNEAASFQTINNGFPGEAHAGAFAQIGQYLFTGLTGNGGSVGIYRTSVNSINWIQKNTGLITFPSVIDIEVKNNDLFVTTQSFNDFGLFRSTNLGNSWFSASPGLSAINTYTYLAVQQGDIYTGTTGAGVYKSTDNGANWTEVNKGLKPLTVFSFLSTSKALFVGFERGIARTKNQAASWQLKTRGLTNTSVTSLYAVQDTLYATARTTNLGSSDGVFFTTDEGQNWTSIDKGLLPSPEVNTLTKTGGNLIIGTGNFGIFIKTPNSTAFKRPAGLKNTLIVNTLLSSSQYVLAGVAGDGELYRSSDYGLSWTKSNNGFSSQEDQIYSFYEKSGVIYAGGFNALYKSTDFGAHWTSSSTGIYPGSNVNGITGLGNDLFAVISSSGNIYKSINNGASWFTVNNGLPQIIYFNAITSANGVLYAASDLGVYKSENSGASWVPMNTGLLPRRNSLSLLVFNGQLFLGTDQTAVWHLPLSSLATTEIAGTAKYSSVKTAKLTGLKFNVTVFPNPTDGHLRVLVEGYKGLTEFTITNSFGQNIYNGSQALDNYSTISIDISSQPKGLYLMSVKTSHETITEKIIIQ